MVNDDTDLYPLNMTKEIITGNDNETVVVTDQGEITLGDHENNEIAQGIYVTDLNKEHSNNVWCDNSVCYLIHCQSQLRKHIKAYPDLKKNSLWQHVSKLMIEHGFYFDAETCETKWRDIKKVYMYNKTYINCNEDSNVNGNDLKESTNDDCVTTVAECENINTTNERDNKICEWTIESTRKLIRMFGKYRKNFSAVNQNLLWEEVAQRFLQLGYNYSANTCHDKWRNLKMTFKQNKQKASKYGPKYIRWIYYKDINNIIKNSLKKNLNNVITTSLNDSKHKNIKKQNDCQFNTNINFQMPNEKIIVNNNGSLKIWTEAATKCLINFWGLYRQRFLMTARGKKCLVWKEISDQLRENGHNYSSMSCNRKWNFLKSKYQILKEKYKKSGMIPVKWQYYQDLDRLLGAPIKTISWNMDSTNFLIDCFNHHKEKLMHASKHEKLLIWKLISIKMSENGFNFSSKACYNKWLTLKNCYIKNKMRFNRNKNVIWAYYNKIDSVLRGFNKEKNTRSNDTNIKDNNNQSCETNEHSIKTKTKSYSIKTEAIIELKDMITSKYTNIDQKLKEMEDNLNHRENVFVEIGQRTLNALDKLNELETQLLTLLEQLILKLPIVPPP